MSWNDHDDTRSQRNQWHNRRVQRILGFVVLFIVLLTVGYLHRDPWLESSRLRLNGLTDSFSANESDPWKGHHRNGSIKIPLGDHVNDLKQAKANNSSEAVKDHPNGVLDELLNDNRVSDKLEDLNLPHELVFEALPALDPTRVALLLETRPLSHLPALISHFISVLPLTWTFRFVGSPESAFLITTSGSLSAHIASGRLTISLLPARFPIDSQESISMTLTDIRFYRDFLAPAEWVLMFQSDSIICAASEHSVEEWIKKRYTWLGAPWRMDMSGGNGGLSLRHIPPIIKLLEREKREKGSCWEDCWLCDRLTKMNGTNMPGAEIETVFSVESLWTPRPWGYHLRGSGKWKPVEIWGNEEHRLAIFEYCPEIKIILDTVLTTDLDPIIEVNHLFHDDNERLLQENTHLQQENRELKARLKLSNFESQAKTGNLTWLYKN